MIKSWRKNLQMFLCTEKMIAPQPVCMKQRRDVAYVYWINHEQELLEFNILQMNLYHETVEV